MEKSIVCILCPKGCAIKVDMVKDTVKEVCGYGCIRGKEYAVSECTHPIRSVTGLVRVSNREYVMLSVKTDKAVPKEKIFDVIEKLNAICVDAPVYIGDIIQRDICGADIVATKTVL